MYKRQGLLTAEWGVNDENRRVKLYQLTPSGRAELGARSSIWSRYVTAVDRVPVSYTHLRAHETVLDLVCRLLLEKKKKNITHLNNSSQTKKNNSHKVHTKNRNINYNNTHTVYHYEIPFA